MFQSFCEVSVFNARRILRIFSTRRAGTCHRSALLHPLPRRQRLRVTTTKSALYVIEDPQSLTHSVAFRFLLLPIAFSVDYPFIPMVIPVSRYPSVCLTTNPRLSSLLQRPFTWSTLVILPLPVGQRMGKPSSSRTLSSLKNKLSLSFSSTPSLPRLFG